MRLTIFEAMEVGLLQVPFHPDNPYLFFAFWLCFVLAAGIQLLLFKKCKGNGRWGFILFSLMGLSICEIGCQIITGWGLIAWLLFWFIFLTFLLGAGLCALFYFIQKKRNNEKI